MRRERWPASCRRLAGRSASCPARGLTSAPTGWRFAKRWAERMRAWAAGCAALVVAPGTVGRAVSLLGVDRPRLVEVPNGIEFERFRPLEVDRREHWHRYLVREPRGWRPG